MANSSKGNADVPDGALSCGGSDMMRELVEMNMLETQVIEGYNPPGMARKHQQVEWVRNTLDGSILKDHKGYPISVNRILATKPLRKDLSNRPGPGGKKLTYMSGEGVTRTLNEIFGFDGWNMEIVKTQREECVRDDKGRFHVAYTAQVRLTHKKSGTFKEDCGSSDSIDRILGTAVAHALKGSITDALKRAARHFGEKLGNTLYQGDFSINKAPLTLRDALDQYDKEREATKFGPVTMSRAAPTGTVSLPLSNTATSKTSARTEATCLLQSNVTVMPKDSSAAPICRPTAGMQTLQSTEAAKTPSASIGTNPRTEATVNQHFSVTTKTPSASSGMKATTNHQSTMQVAKTPSTSTAMKPSVVSATPASNKFRNHCDKGSQQPPKLQLPPSRHSIPSNNVGGTGAPPPPLSAAMKLRIQSSMFGVGGSFGSSICDTEKENAMVQSGPQMASHQANDTLARPATSNGRKSDRSVGWSQQRQQQQQQQQQLGGLKRSASVAGSGMDQSKANKKMTSNPYACK